MRWQTISRWLSADVAIDLGTANTVVCVPHRGIVISEPSAVAMQVKGKAPSRTIAVGTSAKLMLGRTPEGIVAMRPLRDGVIADFEGTTALIRQMVVASGSSRGLRRPRIVIAVPCRLSGVEMRAVRETALVAGAREVHLIEESIAAAIGVGLPVTEPTGSMVIDIGGGTTDVAVISLAGAVSSASIRVGGDKMDEAIVRFIKRHYNLLIGESTAEAIKLQIGSAIPATAERSVEVKGRDLITGGPGTVEIKSDEICEALREPVDSIVEAVRSTLESTPPELASDIFERGMVMVGGGSLLSGLDVLLREHSGLPVVRAENPLHAVALGAGRCLEDRRLLRAVAAAGPARSC